MAGRAVRRGSPLSNMSRPPIVPIGGAEEDQSLAAGDSKWPALPCIWQWESYEEQRGKLTKIQTIHQTNDKKGKANDGRFFVIYRRDFGIPWWDVVKVGVTSSPLRKLLQQYFPGNGDLYTLEEPKLMGRDLFVVRQALHDRLAELPNGSEDGALHLKDLLRFLDSEYKNEIIRARRMEKEKRVSWDMLWAFFSKGTRAAYHCSNTEELLCGTVANMWYEDCFFTIYLSVWDFDGKQYKPCQVVRYIKNFEGELNFAQLSVSPVTMLRNVPRLESGFLANGKRFYELAMKSTSCYMQYSGVMFTARPGAQTGEMSNKLKGDGRVMIDLKSFASMNPNYNMGNARPKSSSSNSYEDYYYYSDDDENSEEDISHDDAHSDEEGVEPSDETLSFAPAIVYGFSFEAKEWGAFAVSGFSDITFDTGAFEELEMDSGTKFLIHNTVGQYILPPLDHDPKDSVRKAEPVKLARVDPIARKGEGCLFLCYGPPGTGKTLTAESIAEKMKQPLWSLSVSELGTSPSELEKTLAKVLEIAAKWKAVLLLDEADVYLEKRVTADVLRNAMTGVFLRLLEYYQGVLFLTTNRVDTFDDAFMSRISLFVHYPPLSLENKAKIWRTMLTKVDVKGVTEEYCKEMAGQEMNGREIRNAIHMAQVWATSNREVLEARHVKYVTETLAKSLKILKRGQ